jgi:hypothetical protein
MMVTMDDILYIDDPNLDAQVDNIVIKALKISILYSG